MTICFGENLKNLRKSKKLNARGTRRFPRYVFSGYKQMGTWRKLSRYNNSPCNCIILRRYHSEDFLKSFDISEFCMKNALQKF